MDQQQISQNLAT
jgi:hypothetical protein